MADKILHYEITKGYQNKVPEGLRFDVVKSPTRQLEHAIRDGIAEAADIPRHEVDGLIGVLKYEEI